jgi:hypothetical protein
MAKWLDILEAGMGCLPPRPVLFGWQRAMRPGCRTFVGARVDEGMWLRFRFEYTAWGFAFRSGAAGAETVKLLNVWG